MPERFALYFAPPATTPLWIRAAQWLGRDAATGDMAEPEIAGISRESLRAISGSARRYGFHATLKAPMALAAGIGRADLEQELAAFTLRHPPVAIGRLHLALLDGFLALVPQSQSDALERFAAACVAQFDRFREPISAAERERRISSGNLSAYQIGLLDHYGYPYVMDEFRFHMTLTDRLPPAGRDAVIAAAQDWFAPVLGASFELDRVSLFHEAGPDAPFQRLADFPLSVKVEV